MENFKEEVTRLVQQLDELHLEVAIVYGRTLLASNSTKEAAEAAAQVLIANNREDEARRFLELEKRKYKSA